MFYSPVLVFFYLLFSYCNLRSLSHPSLFHPSVHQSFSLSSVSPSHPPFNNPSIAAHALPSSAVLNQVPSVNNPLPSPAPFTHTHYYNPSLPPCYRFSSLGCSLAYGTTPTTPTFYTVGKGGRRGGCFPFFPPFKKKSFLTLFYPSPSSLSLHLTSPLPPFPLSPFSLSLFPSVLGVR